MFAYSASGGPLVSLLLSLSDTVDGLHSHERSARLRRTRSGFLAVFEMDHPLPDVRVGGFDNEIFGAFVCHDFYVVRLGGLFHGRTQNRSLKTSVSATGLETGDHPQPEKNILRTENK